MRLPLLRVGAMFAAVVVLLTAFALPPALATADPAARFFIDNTMTFAGLSSSSSFVITPSPGESVTELHADLVATADTTELLIDSFVDGRLTDSQNIDTSKVDAVSVLLGDIVSTAEVTVRVSHTSDECRNDDARIVELVNIEFEVDGLPLRPVGPQDFFPPHLSRVAVAMDTPGDPAAQEAALNTMARIAARYRRDDFTIDLVALSDLEFLQADERAVVVDGDIALLEAPQLSEVGPKVLRIHPLAGVTHLSSMLELSSPPAQDRDIYVRVGDISRDLSAQGITSAELEISVPQTLFSRIPESYDVHLAGWTSMPHISELAAQVLTVTAGDQIVHTQTVTDSGPFDASFSIVEPPRDLDLRLTLRGPDVGEACKIETAAMELSVDPLSSIAPIGQRSDEGFGSLPQGFAGAWSIDAEGDAWPRAARLMTLVQRPSATPLTVTETGPTIAVRVTDEYAALTMRDDGLLIEGTLQSIDELLDQLAEDSWYALDGDIAQVGGTGLVTQFIRAEAVTIEGDAPERIGAHEVPAEFSPVAATEPEGAEEAELAEAAQEVVPTAAAPDLNEPPGTLAFTEDDDGSPGGKDLPGSALAGAAVLTIAGGILVNRRDTLLGRRPGGS